MKEKRGKLIINERFEMDSGREEKAKCDIEIYKKEALPTDSKSYNIYIPQSKLELYNQRIITVKPIVVDTKVVETKKTTKVNNENIKQNKTVEVKKEVKKADKPIIHIVKKGDSFETISKKYKVDLNKLKNDNNKKSNLIKIGDKIEIYK
jgi:membrane-bound lytic murein transglycosylase D